MQELSLKEFIIKIYDQINYLFRKKWLIAAFAILGALLGVLFSKTSKPIYTGELTFVLEDNKSNSLGAYAGLASQFGIDLSGSISNGAFNGDNILELLQSRLLVEKALLTGSVLDNGHPISLADWYIKFNDLTLRWKNYPQLANINFPMNQDRSKFSRTQDSILNTIQQSLVAKNLIIDKPDKKLSFISVMCKSKDELFSKAFTERLVTVALDLYVDTKTRRNKVNIDRLQLQADSLEGMLNKKTYSAAQIQDINSNPARKIAEVGVELQMRDKVVLQTMYAEVMKNLELSKIAMAQDAPVIQIVDTPILPLEVKKIGLLKGLIIGGFLGGFLTCAILILRKIYKTIMA